MRRCLSRLFEKNDRTKKTNGNANGVGLIRLRIQVMAAQNEMRAELTDGNAAQEIIMAADPLLLREVVNKNND